MSEKNTVRIGFVLFPDVLQLDFTGPYGVFAQVPGVAMHIAAGTLQPIASSDRLVLSPTDVFAECPALDMLVVPGGGGVDAAMLDDAVLGFVRKQSATCRYVTSVCTGSLVLGAAGLLGKRRATTHWQSLELLRHFDAMPAKERVVFDGNIVTAAGVTSGIDMALALVGRIWGEDRVRMVQLGMEYSPRPPYDGGDPETAPPSVVQSLLSRNAERQKRREKAVLEAAQRLDDTLEANDKR